MTPPPIALVRIGTYHRVRRRASSEPRPHLPEEQRRDQLVAVHQLHRAATNHPDHLGRSPSFDHRSGRKELDLGAGRESPEFTFSGVAERLVGADEVGDVVHKRSLDLHGAERDTACSMTCSAG
jgi:hypothetical protein